MTGPADPTRAEAAAALLAALRDVRDANERLQLAAAWVFEAFGDTADAETIRMLPVGIPGRPGRPPVPGSLEGISQRTADAIADLVDADRYMREGRHSVTGDESGSGQ